MSWCDRLVAIAILLSLPLAAADDKALWQEYGLVKTSTVAAGKLSAHLYEFKDLTGALAAWEWQRSPNARSCDLASLCSRDGERTIVSGYNYVIVFEGGVSSQADVNGVFANLHDKHESSLPVLLTFLPMANLVPNSARYILGPASLAAFAPELGSRDAGFAQGAEAQVADYRLPGINRALRLALFNYATFGMAREHAAAFAKIPGVQVKRSGVLVALVLPPATNSEGDTLLSRVQYNAKVTWNEVPPPSPVKPLYRLLVNIIYLSIVLVCLCLFAGLMYAGMRIYRRRYGTLESEEAMTTLRLS